jgi:hypothetical protein
MDFIDVERAPAQAVFAGCGSSFLQLSENSGSAGCLEKDAAEEGEASADFNLKVTRIKLLSKIASQASNLSRRLENQHGSLL